MDENRRLSRRGSLLTLGGLLAGAVGARAWTAGDAEGAGPAGVASGVVKCVLTPEQTEGPYYIADEAVRRNITEGKTGVPLTLRAFVVDASTCKAIKGASVDIWHCDASGVYSGFGSGAANRTFLRGVQRTDAHGLALFKTLYPGWYTGRAVHIHVKVHIAGNVVHTGQLYFPEKVTSAVYKRAPYASRGAPNTSNAQDAIFRNGGSKSLVSLKKSGSAYVGTIVMGVVRS